MVGAEGGRVLEEFETRKNEFGAKVLKAGEEMNAWDPPPPAFASLYP